MAETKNTLFDPIRWWKWARKHPGTLLLGAVLLTVLVLPQATTKRPPSPDLDADETPLFI